MKTTKTTDKGEWHKECEKKGSRGLQDSQTLLDLWTFAITTN